jgi:hypothetical protein
MKATPFFSFEIESEQVLSQVAAPSLSSGNQNYPVTNIEVENLNRGVSQKLMPRRRGKRPIDDSRFIFF